LEPGKEFTQVLILCGLAVCLRLEYGDFIFELYMRKIVRILCV
jgi:hypothetical protein